MFSEQHLRAAYQTLGRHLPTKVIAAGPIAPISKTVMIHQEQCANMCSCGEEARWTTWGVQLSSGVCLIIDNLSTDPRVFNAVTRKGYRWPNKSSFLCSLACLAERLSAQVSCEVSSPCDDECHVVVDAAPRVKSLPALHSQGVAFSRLIQDLGDQCSLPGWYGAWFDENGQVTIPEGSRTGTESLRKALLHAYGTHIRPVCANETQRCEMIHRMTSYLTSRTFQVKRASRCWRQ